MTVGCLEDLADIRDLVARVGELLFRELGLNQALGAATTLDPATNTISILCVQLSSYWAYLSGRATLLSLGFMSAQRSKITFLLLKRVIMSRIPIHIFRPVHLSVAVASHDDG